MMEDEETVSNPRQTLTETLDPTLQKKHLSMLEHLSNRHQTRLDNTLTRRSECHSSSSPSFESTSSFLSRFSDFKRSIESQLADSRIASSHPAGLNSHLEKISASISDLEKLVAENSYFLPSYDVRASLKTISDLRLNLDSLNSELIPKNKFSFRWKVNKKEPAVEEAKEAANPDSIIILPEKTSFTVRDSPGFRNKVGEVLVGEFRGSDVGEFTISDLDSCEVRWIGSFRVLFVHRLKNCRVYVGPVLGSILIEEVVGCLFMVASHQIRIHGTKESNFYLRVRSRPIIEDTINVRFAPYSLTYNGIEEDLRGATLFEDTGNWANVDDFRWLRAIQSPNWSILPENDRIATVNISNLEKGE
ncbi:tubulin-folding cofactor C [Quillaja saponaria]|uniref:Tubulin-folding cofactor C n=1 Tax=Quillaja saponaria TaxID=32244 RepID=A0AAD7LER4_QUISA|nr:tubulin-folding cofactor C [Quillaja saponaria]